MRDYLKLHLIVFLWGFTAILGLLIRVPAMELVVFRTFLASAGLLVLILMSARSLSLPAGDIGKLLLTGFVVAVHWITFFGSARMANASVSLVGFATASLWTAFLEPLVNRRSVKQFEVFLGLVVILGLYIIYRFDFRYPLALLVAILSGLLSAMYFVINARFARRIDVYIISFYEMTGAFIGALLYVAIAHWSVPGQAPLELPGVTDWIYLAILGWVCTVYAYIVSLRLMKRLSVFFMQLTINLEPLYGILLALLIFGERERMSVPFYAGAALILGAVLSYPLLRKKFDRADTLSSSEPAAPR